MSEASEWVSLGEAAEIIGVHPATIRNWAERGELPFRRTPGGHRRFRRSDLMQWLVAHRVTHSSEAQVMVHSALGRTRLEIGDKQKLLSQSWYEQLTPQARDLMRQHGLRLMDALLHYLTDLEVEADLHTAREIGEMYGVLLIGENLPLSDAIEGYFYFSNILLDAVLRFSETSGPRPLTGWGDMLRQVNRFTREILIGMVTVYDQTKP